MLKESPQVLAVDKLLAILDDQKAISFRLISIWNGLISLKSKTNPIVGEMLLERTGLSVEDLKDIIKKSSQNKWFINGIIKIEPVYNNVKVKDVLNVEVSNDNANLNIDGSMEDDLPGSDQENELTNNNLEDDYIRPEDFKDDLPGSKEDELQKDDSKKDESKSDKVKTDKTKADKVKTDKTKADKVKTDK